MITYLNKLVRDQIFITLVIKFFGMLFLFIGIKILIDKVGLDTYGRYAQTISFLLLFISVASLGFSQSFIRKVANLKVNKKNELYRRKQKVIFTVSFLLTPILFFFLYSFLERDFLSSCVVSLIFLLTSSLRLRFTYIRTSKIVKFSEVPDLIIRAFIFFVLLYFLDITTESQLYIIAFISFLSAYLTQFLMIRDLKLFSNLTLLNFKSLKKEVDFNELKIWLYNTFIQAKEFLEISIILMLMNAAIAGEYKVLMQFSLGFMAVFNSLNLVNSASYAKMIANDEIIKINHKARSEFMKGIIFFILILLTFALINNTINIFETFSLSENANYVFYLILISPFINLCIGPVSQLNIHLRNLNYLNIFYVIRLILIALLILFSSIIEGFNLYHFVSYQVAIELLFLLSLAIILKIKHNYSPPILSTLRGI